MKPSVSSASALSLRPLVSASVRPSDDDYHRYMERMQATFLPNSGKEPLFKVDDLDLFPVYLAQFRFD